MCGDFPFHFWGQAALRTNSSRESNGAAIITGQEPLIRTRLNRGFLLFSCLVWFTLYFWGQHPSFRYDIGQRPECRGSGSFQGCARGWKGSFGSQGTKGPLGPSKQLEAFGMVAAWVLSGKYCADWPFRSDRRGRTWVTCVLWCCTGDAFSSIVTRS